jgi:hypothetical protein
MIVILTARDSILDLSMPEWACNGMGLKDEDKHSPEEYKFTMKRRGLCPDKKIWVSLPPHNYQRKICY